MTYRNRNKEIKEILSNSSHIAILPNKLGGCDALMAGVALYHMLRLAGKSPSVLYPWDIPNDCTPNDALLDGAIVDPKRSSLEVAVDLSGTDASEVQYTTDNHKIVFKIDNLPGDFNPDSRISISKSLSRYDTFITLKAQVPVDLGYVFNVIEKDFYAGKVINIDTTRRNLLFGNANLIDTYENLVSMIILKNFSHWGLSLPEKAAASLLIAISGTFKNVDL